MFENCSFNKTKCIWAAFSLCSSNIMSGCWAILQPFCLSRAMSLRTMSTAKGKEKREMAKPQLSFSFLPDAWISSSQYDSHTIITQQKATQQKDPKPLDPLTKWSSPAQVSFPPTQRSSCMLTEPTDTSILYLPSCWSLTMLTPPLQESAKASQDLYYNPVTCVFDTK